MDMPSATPPRGGVSIPRAAALAAVIVALPLGPARADATDTVVSATQWSQVGTAGQAVRVQVRGNPVILSTGPAAPTGDAGPQVAPGDPDACLVLTQNLWAKAVGGATALGGTATVKTLTGLSCPGATPEGSTLTQTRVTLAPGVSGTLVPANAGRRSLRWMNTGANPMTAAPGAGPVTAGQGMNFDPGASTSGQGGGTSFDGGSVPTNAFSAVSAGGTVVTVWEGN